LMIASVMAIDVPLFDKRHSPEIFLFPGLVRKLGIAPGHFQVGVSQQLLQTLQSHAGI